MIHAHFSVVGDHNRLPDIKKDIPHVPREGDTVAFPNGQGDLIELIVRLVGWYLFEDTPFVYIVLGDTRRGGVWPDHIA